MKEHIMATNDPTNWSELLDVALFEPDRVELRQRIEQAKDAIQKRMEEILKNENQNAGSSISERVALRNALTMADLHNIAYARKPSRSVSRQSGQAITG
jgi:hypothetical protein